MTNTTLGFVFGWWKILASRIPSFSVRYFDRPNLRAQAASSTAKGVQERRHGLSKQLCRDHRGIVAMLVHAAQALQHRRPSASHTEALAQPLPPTQSPVPAQRATDGAASLAARTSRN